MQYDEMIRTIDALLRNADGSTAAMPHGSNLLYQLRKRDANKEALFAQLVEGYLNIRAVEHNSSSLSTYVQLLVDAVNRYMDLLWPPSNNPFSHQVDFYSSIVPEMLCILFHNVIHDVNEGLEVSAQRDLTIECTFDMTNGGRVRFKKKRVDVAVVRMCDLTFNGVKEDLPVPLIAIEVKTNLDKNMLAGIENSVNDLKKTFPLCHYYVVSELSDFDVMKQNYASSGIDEIFILRKQKRAQVRNNPSLRKPLSSDLLLDLALTLKQGVELMTAETVDMNTRMKGGKLIWGAVCL